LGFGRVRAKREKSGQKRGFKFQKLFPSGEGGGPLRGHRKFSKKTADFPRLFFQKLKRIRGQFLLNGGFQNSAAFKNFPFWKKAFINNLTIFTN